MEAIDLIQARANLLKRVRAFFEAEGVIEVETPLLYPFATSDPYIQHLSLPVRGETFYLQSSPEFAMKRLLEKATVPIYQICKAFRNDGEGTRHKTEFSMLEWYMPEWELQQLLEQCMGLFSSILSCQEFKRITYRDAFIDALRLDPFEASMEELQECVQNNLSVNNLETFSRDECIHLLFAEKVEKSFNPDLVTFVEDFPASQSALATCEKDSHGNLIAKRFEIFFAGLELANAYQEENNPDILRARFEKENQLRIKSAMPEIPIDEAMLLAMKNIPVCSGIALGLDRLLMCQLKLTSIQELNIV